MEFAPTVCKNASVNFSLDQSFCVKILKLLLINRHPSRQVCVWGDHIFGDIEFNLKCNLGPGTTTAFRTQLLFYCKYVI